VTEDADPGANSSAGGFPFLGDPLP